MDSLDKNVGLIVRKTQEEVNRHSKLMELVPELEIFLKNVSELIPNEKY